MPLSAVRCDAGLQAPGCMPAVDVRVEVTCAPSPLLLSTMGLLLNLWPPVSSASIDVAALIFRSAPQPPITAHLLRTHPHLTRTRPVPVRLCLCALRPISRPRPGFRFDAAPAPAPTEPDLTAVASTLQLLALTGCLSHIANRAPSSLCCCCSTHVRTEVFIDPSVCTRALPHHNNASALRTRIKNQRVIAAAARPAPPPLYVT